MPFDGESLKEGENEKDEGREEEEKRKGGEGGKRRGKRRRKRRGEEEEEGGPSSLFQMPRFSSTSTRHLEFPPLLKPKKKS